MKPMVGNLPGCCCAPALSGHVAAAPPSSVMNSRRFMPNMGLPPLTKISAADVFETATGARHGNSRLNLPLAKQATLPGLCTENQTEDRL
jgi:hypothetical protein